MAKKNTPTKDVSAVQALLKKPKTKKASPKAKQLRGLSNAELRELMKTNKPAQSWYDENHVGLY